MQSCCPTLLPGDLQTPVEFSEKTSPASPLHQDEEVVFYEGHGGSGIEMAISLALTATLIFAPLTIASLGRRLWIKYKFTNKRE